MCACASSVDRVEAAFSLWIFALSTCCALSCQLHCARFLRPLDRAEAASPADSESVQSLSSSSGSAHNRFALCTVGWVSSAPHFARRCPAALEVAAAAGGLGAAETAALTASRAAHSFRSWASSSKAGGGSGALTMGSAFCFAIRAASRSGARAYQRARSAAALRWRMRVPSSDLAASTLCDVLPFLASPRSWLRSPPLPPRRRRTRRTATSEARVTATVTRGRSIDS